MCVPLNGITLGSRQTDSIDQMIQLTNIPIKYPLPLCGHLWTRFHVKMFYRPILTATMTTESNSCESLSTFSRMKLSSQVRSERRWTPSRETWSRLIIFTLQKRNNPLGHISRLKFVLFQRHYIVSINVKINGKMNI